MWDRQPIGGTNGESKRRNSASVTVVKQSLSKNWALENGIVFYNEGDVM